MVAEMTAFGTNIDHFKDGNEDISPQDEKDTLAENENSGSDGTEDSSEEEESANEGSIENDYTEEQDASPKLETQQHNGGGTLTKAHCSNCEASQQKEDCESVTPRRISRGRYLLFLEHEGTYQCSVTGLVFEVSQKVKIQYTILSWAKYGTFLNDSWKIAGPIFDVDCDPSILKSIQFPHSLCVSDLKDEVTFSILHVKNHRSLIEPSVDHSGSHIKWAVTSLSPVGPIVRTSQHTEHHGVVLIYKEVAQRPTSSFSVYLAANNHSDVNDIKKLVQRSKKKYIKIEKPPTCQRLLEENKVYRLTSDPEGEIDPKEIQFSLEPVKLKAYFEVFFEQPPPFQLRLIEVDSGQTVWTATLRAGDCEDSNTESTRKRSQSRKRNISTSDEEPSSKRSKWEDVPDGTQPVKHHDVTDQQLMMVAKKMGKDWQQLAILYLGLSMQDIEGLQDEDLTMRKFKMLGLWRRRAKGGASVSLLYEALNKDDVPNELRDTLAGRSVLIFLALLAAGCLTACIHHTSEWIV